MFKRRTAGPPCLPEQFDPADARRILVISCTAIGDTMFATPGIRALRGIVPNAAIDLLVKTKFLDLFRANPRVDRLIGYHGRYKGAVRLLRRFRKSRYNLCIVFHDSDPCPVEAAYLAGIPFIFRIGQRDERVARLLSCRIPYNRKRHAIDQRLEVLRVIFGVGLDRKDDLRMELPVNAQNSRRLWKRLAVSARLSLEQSRIIGFQFSASRLYQKWPAENFVQLGARLLNISERHTICLMGGPEDRKQAEKIANEIAGITGSGRRILNLAGEIALSSFPDMLYGLDLLVTNDTGPLHVAIAVRTPTISLFVPSDPGITGPVQDLDMHTVITKERPCSPCSKKYCQKPYCMKLISVDEVFDAVLATLRDPNPEQPKGLWT